MLRRPTTRRPSPALVVAVVALFAALAGSSYAEPIRGQLSAMISGKRIMKRSLTGKQVRRNAFTGFHIKEGKLGTVRKAKKAASAAHARNADNASNASNADKLDGKDSLEFAQGNVTLLAGRTTGAAGPDPNPIRTFDTPVGRFDLSCGVANADSRYRNTTGSNQEVYRVSIRDGIAPTHTFLDAAPNANIGFAATVGTGPTLVELSAGSGDTHARMRVQTRRVGTTCTWNWELMISR